MVTMVVVLAGLTVVPDRLDVNIAFPLVGGAVLLGALVNPRLEWSLLGIAIYLTCIDGPLKLMSGSENATLLRDVVIFAVAAGVLVRMVVEEGKLPRIPYRGAVLCLFLALVIQIFNPLTPSLTGVIAGFRQQIEFAPLLVLGVLVARRRDLLPTVGLVLLALTVPNAIAALVQNGLTPEQFAKWGPGYADRVLGLGAFENAPRTFYEGGVTDRVRPFGLGADAGGAGVMGWMTVPFALAFLLSRSWRQRIWLGVGGFAMCGLAVLTSQSRGALLTALIAVLVFFVLRARSRNALSTAVALGGALLLIFSFVTVFAETSDDASLTRLKTVAPGQAASTITEGRGRSLALTPDYVVDYPLGVGLGRAGPGSGLVGAPSGLDSENQFNFLIGEIGVFGLASFMLLWLLVVRDAFVLSRRERDEWRRTLWCAVAAALIAMTVVWFQAPVSSATPIAPVFWFLAGFVGTSAAAELRAGSRSARPGMEVRLSTDPIRG